MSLRGRYWIDRLKQRVSRWLTLPVPPYQSPAYWEGVYQSLGAEDVYEWGGITYREHLERYDYRLVWSSSSSSSHDESFASGGSTAPITSSFLQQQPQVKTHSSTLAETLGITATTTTMESLDHLNDDKNATKPPILLLGCGNSKLGEDMLESSCDDPSSSFGQRRSILQVDVVPRVVETMSQRCAKYIEQQHRMNVIQDDARQLSALEDHSVAATIDKGLVDALFCANQYVDVHQVMRSVHRTLVSGGIACVFSFSQPEFLLQHVLPERKKHNMWSNVQVRQLDSILLYRFQKQQESAINNNNNKTIRKQRGKHPRHRQRRNFQSQ